MIGICAAMGHYLPCLIPLKTFLIQEKSHELRDRYGGMRIIHLEYNIFRQLMDIVMLCPEGGKRTLKGRGDEEVLLTQSQLLTLHMIVVGIKHLCQGTCQIGILHCQRIIALVKLIQVEIRDCLCVPDTQSVDHAVAVAHYRDIVGYRTYRCVILLSEYTSAVDYFCLYTAAESHFLGIFGSLHLKGIAVPEPFIRYFVLIAVPDLLPEHAVMIADAAAVCRVIK